MVYKWREFALCVLFLSFASSGLDPTRGTERGTLTQA